MLYALHIHIGDIYLVLLMKDRKKNICRHGRIYLYYDKGNRKSFFFLVYLFPYPTRISNVYTRKFTGSPEKKKNGHRLEYRIRKSYNSFLC